MPISAPSTNLSSIQSALSMSAMRNAMNQDAQSVAGLLEGMEEMTEEIQQVVEGRRGNNIDVRV